MGLPEDRYAPMKNREKTRKGRVGRKKMKRKPKKREKNPLNGFSLTPPLCVQIGVRQYHAKENCVVLCWGGGGVGQMEVGWKKYKKKFCFRFEILNCLQKKNTVKQKILHLFIAKMDMPAQHISKRGEYVHHINGKKIVLLGMRGNFGGFYKSINCCILFCCCQGSLFPSHLMGIFGSTIYPDER